MKKDRIISCIGQPRIFAYAALALLGHVGSASLAQTPTVPDCSNLIGDPYREIGKKKLTKLLESDPACLGKIAASVRRHSQAAPNDPKRKSADLLDRRRAASVKMKLGNLSRSRRRLYVISKGLRIHTWRSLKAPILKKPLRIGDIVWYCPTYGVDSDGEPNKEFDESGDIWFHIDKISGDCSKPIGWVPLLEKDESGEHQLVSLARWRVSQLYSLRNKAKLKGDVKSVNRYQGRINALIKRYGDNRVTADSYIPNDLQSSALMSCVFGVALGAMGGKAIKAIGGGGVTQSLVGAAMGTVASGTPDRKFTASIVGSMAVDFLCGTSPACLALQVGVCMMISES